MSATDHQQLSAKINTILDQLMKLQANWESNLKSLQVSYEERLKEMRGMREQINAALDELEKATLKEMDEVKASWNTSLKFDIDSCFRLHTELTHLSDAIKVIGKKNEELAFIAHQKSKVMIKHVEKYLNNNSLQTEVSLKLIVYNGIKAYLSNLAGLSHTTHITKDLTKKRPDRAILVTGENLFSVKIEFVFRSIKGICGLFNGHILFAHDTTLKLLDLQHKVVSECFISYFLSDMSLITPCKVAVTVDRGIQFGLVNSGKPVRDSLLQLPHDCRGVAHHQGDLYVTSGTAMYKYNLTGTLVNKMYEDRSARDTVLRCAVSPSGDKIYVTNHSEHKLLTLARNGTVISTFTDTELQLPWGVHVTPVGQVLVCGYRSNTVIQVDREGKKKIALLAVNKDGVDGPRSVFYNWKYDYVLVGQQNDKILMLHLKMNNIF